MSLRCTTVPSSGIAVPIIGNTGHGKPPNIVTPHTTQQISVGMRNPMKASRRDFSHFATASSSTLRVSRAPEPYGTSAGHRHQVVEHAGQLAERLGRRHGVGPLVVLHRSSRPSA